MIDAFDEAWERRYQAGLALNSYPFDVIVSLTAKYFGGASGRGRSVLDLGAGAGNHALFYARLGFDVTCVDVSASAIAVARARFEHEGLTAQFHVMGFEDIDALGTFDLVVDRGSLTHAAHGDLRGSIMSKVRARMAPDGLLFSWFFSSAHPSARRHVPRGSDDYTIADALANDPGTTVHGTFLPRHGIEGLFADFEIVQLYHEVREELYVAHGEPPLGATAEFIVVCRRGDDRSM